MGEAPSLIVAVYVVSFGASLLMAAPLFFLIGDLSPSVSVVSGKFWVRSDRMVRLHVHHRAEGLLGDHDRLCCRHNNSIRHGALAWRHLPGIRLVVGLQYWPCAIAFALPGRILAEYPSDVRNVQNLGKRLWPLWPYLVVGALHNLGGWSGIWIMW